VEVKGEKEGAARKGTMANLYHRNLSREELARYVGHLDQIAGIRLVEGADGVERGVRILQVWTGTGLSFNVLADRGMDISSCQYKGISLTWRSPVGDAHPAYSDASGAAWLWTFQGGLVVTCGLDNFGPATQDEGEEVGQHGRASSLPAKAVSYQACWKDDTYRLEISGEMRQTRVYGENLVLRRRIGTALGSNKIRIEDTVTNEGFSPHPHMLLYDVNLGFPLLSEHARLKFEVEKTVPWDDLAREEIAEWMVFEPPAAGYVERDYTHTPRPDGDGWGRVELENQELKLGFRLSFDLRTLPYLAQWKMMREGLYVLAVQPMNTHVWGGRAEVRKQNALPYLQPGESRDYTLELEVVEY
jgi:hypothetical protein